MNESKESGTDAGLGCCAMNASGVNSADAGSPAAGVFFGMNPADKSMLSSAQDPTGTFSGLFELSMCRFLSAPKN
jgi:hypothetical protein